MTEPPRFSGIRNESMNYGIMSAQCFNLAYWSSVRLRNAPPRPIAIPWYTMSRLSCSLNPPPRSTSSITFSAEVKRNLLGSGVRRSASKN